MKSSVKMAIKNHEKLQVFKNIVLKKYWYCTEKIHCLLYPSIYIEVTQNYLQFIFNTLITQFKTYKNCFYIHLKMFFSKTKTRNTNTKINKTQMMKHIWKKLIVYSFLTNSEKI